MENLYSIRLADERDSRDMLRIYEPFVLSSAITFEYEVPTVEEYSERIKANTLKYPWLLCLHNDLVAGFAYAGTHRYRTAYQWSVESSIYLDPEVHGKGIAGILYDTLFSILRLQGFVNVYAGIAMPNDRSERFHRAAGFDEIGCFVKIGYKFGKWHDVKWFQYPLTEHAENPALPRSMHEIQSAGELQEILDSANERLKNSGL